MFVYQITNLINGKIYIGITNNYKRRWANECCKSFGEDKPQVISLAIQKYGKENFKFEVLQEGLSIEEASEKEIELIQEKNSLVPNGYNVAKGGMYVTEHNIKEGSENGNARLTEEQAQYIKDHCDQPAYLLYELFVDILTYPAFLDCYYGRSYKNITSNVSPYPLNREFSSQFSSSKITYEEVVELRKQYQKGVYWREAYEPYKEIYTNELSFWNVYNGKRFQYIMPEVFTEELKHKHSSMIRSGSKNGRAKLNEEDVRNIRKLHQEGKENKEIQKLYPQVSTTSIRDIINFKTWKNID